MAWDNELFGKLASQVQCIPVLNVPPQTSPNASSTRLTFTRNWLRSIVTNPNGPSPAGQPALCPPPLIATPLPCPLNSADSARQLWVPDRWHSLLAINLAAQRRLLRARPPGLHLPDCQAAAAHYLRLYYPINASFRSARELDSPARRSTVPGLITTLKNEPSHGARPGFVHSRPALSSVNWCPFHCSTISELVVLKLKR